MIKGSENLPIGDLLSRRVPFQIPIYQRGYAWEEEEVSDFSQDIGLLVPDKRHFFGGLVSVERFAAGTATGRVYEIVDGQQRIATFFIALALLVKALDQLADEAQQQGDAATQNTAKAHAEQTRRDFLFYDEVEQGQLTQKLRLTMSKADRAFFEQLARGGSPAPTRDSHRRIQQAHDQIHENLLVPILSSPGTTISAKVDKLLKLRATMTNSCHVIFIVSDNALEAYQLFAVLNDRGRSLTDGDLLRSFSLELLEGHVASQGHAEQYWDEILSAPHSSVDQFLRAYYPSQLGVRAPTRDLYDSLRKAFFPQTAPIQSPQDVAIVERVSNMATEVKNFRQISDGQWPYVIAAASAWDQDRLNRLICVLRHTLAVPLLMAARHCLAESKFVEIIRIVERFAFRYITIAGSHAGGPAAVYYAQALAIRNNPAAYNTQSLATALRHLIQQGANDNLFEVGIKEKLSYTTGSNQKRLIKHFLTTLEDYQSWVAAGAVGNPQPTTLQVWDIDSISIEHIYPQNPDVLDQTMEPVKHDISNLAFWGPGENSAAGNDVFAQKRQRYLASTVQMLKRLAQLPNWDMAAYTNRQHELIDAAKKVFVV